MIFIIKPIDIIDTLMKQLLCHYFSSELLDTSTKTDLPRPRLAHHSVTYPIQEKGKLPQRQNHPLRYKSAGDHTKRPQVTPKMKLTSFIHSPHFPCSCSTKIPSTQCQKINNGAHFSNNEKVSEQVTWLFFFDQKTVSLQKNLHCCPNISDMGIYDVNFDSISPFRP